MLYDFFTVNKLAEKVSQTLITEQKDQFFSNQEKQFLQKSSKVEERNKSFPYS